MYILYEGNIRAEMCILSSLILQSVWRISVKRSTSYFTTNVNPNNQHYIQQLYYSSSIHYAYTLLATVY
jgi:hypothetical protein